MNNAYGQIRQLAWVVPDIEQAMAHWSGVLGVGPWFYKERVGVTTFRYRGEDSAPPDLSIAFANSGELQVELIQQRNDVPSMYRDFMTQTGGGMQHVAFWTTAFDEVVARLLASGYSEGHAGQVGQRGRFAYFVHASMPGNVIEISEQTGGKAEFFREIAQAAAGWDGSEPVRRVG
ncbi:MAG: VOC family protein [Burkholderiaceae bacterium]|nr:VOC family protein [Burkholderiaceae bacterium]